MTLSQRFSLVALRVTAGWLLFYAGITKVFAVEWFGASAPWSAAGYLNNAKTFPEFYSWLAGSDMLPVINFLNQWGLTLLGIMLMLGLATRLSALLAAGIMVLYYFPVLEYPYIGDHSYLVDDHVIYALAFFVLGAFRAGRVWGMDALLRSRGVFKKGVYAKLVG
ncbi:MAG: DoxX family membrane protein [Candidatus Spechtbacterales bacterium]